MPHRLSLKKKSVMSHISVGTDPDSASTAAAAAEATEISELRQKKTRDLKI